MEANLTISEAPPQWNSEPMYHLPPWGEPLVGISPSTNAKHWLIIRVDCFVYIGWSNVPDEEAEFQDSWEKERGLS